MANKDLHTFPSADDADNNDDSDSLIYSIPAVVLLLVFGLPVIAVTITANSLVIASYVTDARLRTVSNLYLLHLALCDLVVGLVSMPVYLVSAIMGTTWPFRNVFCKVYLLLDYIMCTQSVFLVILISVDQLLILRKGNSYTVTETRGKAYTKITVAWVAACLVYGPAIAFWDLVDDFSGLTQLDCDKDFYVTDTYVIAAVHMDFILPAIAMIVLNALVYCEIQKQTQAIQKIADADFEGAAANSRSKKTKCFPYCSCKKTLISPEERYSDCTQNNSISTVHLRRTGPGDNTNNSENIHPPSTEVCRLFREESLKHDTKRQFQKANEACELRFVAVKAIKEEKTSPDQCSVTDTCVESSDAELLGETNAEQTAHPECQKTRATSTSSTRDHRSALNSDCCGGEGDRNENSNAIETSPRPISNQTFDTETPRGRILNQTSFTETSQKRISNQTLRSGTPQRRRSTLSLVFNRFALNETTRRKLKVANALFIFVIVFLVLWAPYSINSIVDAFCQRQCTNEYASELFDWILWFKSAVNPFLYTASNALFKMNFYRILSMICPCCKVKLKRLSSQANK